MSYDRIDQWMDWGDHTVTVDPLRNKAWIHEGQDGKHLATAERGRGYDRQDTLHILSLLKSTQPDARVGTYLPTAGDLRGFFDHCPENCNDIARGRKITSDRPGQFPIIDHLQRDGAFPEEDTGTIERQILGSQQRVSDRIMSRGGVPDHGLTSS